MVPHTLLLPPLLVLLRGGLRGVGLADASLLLVEREDRGEEVGGGKLLPEDSVFELLLFGEPVVFREEPGLCPVVPANARSGKLALSTTGLPSQVLCTECYLRTRAAAARGVPWC